MILNIDDNFYFDLQTSILFFNMEKYKLLNDENKQRFIDFFLRQRIDKHNRKRVIKTINLIPSMSCDGRCLYCYNEEVNNTIEIDMSIEKLEDNLKELENEYILDLETIRMYGGEPLKNICLDKIINFLLTYNKDMVFYISTGLFVPEDVYQKQLAIFKQLSTVADISIGVGVDLGTYPETRVCPYMTKQDLLHRCDDLITNDINIIFVNTVTKNTCVNKLFDEITELEVKYKDRPNAPKFRVAIACDNIYSPSLKQIDLLYDKLKEIYKNANSLNITSNIYPYLDVIYAPKIYKIFDDMYYFMYDSFYCGVFSDMITILSNNTFKHCHMNITDNAIDIIDFKNKKQMLYNEECEVCDYFKICRGGCFYRHMIMNDVLEDNKNVYCEWIKKSFKLSLYRLINMGSDNIRTFLDNL